MSGLIFLAALALCLWGCVRVAKNPGNLVPNPAWRSVVKIALFVVLLASPFVDEVIGKQQFEALCKANGIEGADVSKARGKRVKLEVGERRPLDGTIMPIASEIWSYSDADSGAALFKHNDYYAMGGWLMRYTPLDMGSPKSMFFPGNGCNLNIWQSTLNAAQVTVIN
jgi:hypothetical protein